MSSLCACVRNVSRQHIRVKDKHAHTHVRIHASTPRRTARKHLTLPAGLPLRAQVPEARPERRASAEDQTRQALPEERGLARH